MFDIGWSELVVIGVVALIAIGPKELPGVLRMVGQWVGKMKRMASDFQGQFQEAMREAEMADLKKQVDEVNRAASSFASMNPISAATGEVEKAIDTALASTTPAVGEGAPPPADPIPSGTMPSGTMPGPTSDLAGPPRDDAPAADPAPSRTAAAAQPQATEPPAAEVAGIPQGQTAPAAAPPSAGEHR